MKMFNSVSYDFIRLSVQEDKNVKNIETRLQNKNDLQFDTRIRP